MCHSLNVLTKYGLISGTFDENVNVWRGVPYAKPPVGELRFKKSVACDCWTGVRDCTSFSHIAPQKEDKKTKYSDMSEDCLYLNIWSPEADNGKRPVIVYLHGGSYCHGAGSNDDCNGRILAEKGNLVFVTVNYRLGVLGCLDFEKYGDFDSNCAFSDIVNALKWVYENIEAFGGDPDNITVMGQSAGAITISALITNKEPRKYISKAFVMSSGPTLFQSKEEVCHLADQFLELSKFSASDLRSVPFEKIIEYQNQFSAYCGLGSGTFALTVDGESIERWPIPAAACIGDKKHIPVVMGNTLEEMSFLFIKPIAKSLEIDQIMNEGVSEEPEEVRTEIPKMYERYGKRGKSIMMADLVFRLASVWFTETYSMHSDVWMYSFEYETVASKIAGLRAFHSSDMPFYFGDYKAGLAKWTFIFTPNKQKAQAIADVMQTDLFKFIRTGKCDWEKCVKAKTPVKAYGNTISYHQAIEPDIKKAYLMSQFRKRSFEEYYDECCRLYD